MKVTAEEFDELFESGADMTPYLNWDRAYRPGLETQKEKRQREARWTREDKAEKKAEAKEAKRESKRVNIDFPPWMVGLLDEEAKRVGVTRQSIVKMWIAEKLEKIAAL